MEGAWLGMLISALAGFAPCVVVEVTECSCSLRKFPSIKSPSCGEHMTGSHTGFAA